MKKIVKQYIRMTLFAVVVMLSITLIPQKAEAAPIRNVTAITKSKTKIKLKWKANKKVSQIRIYRTSNMKKDPYNRKNLKKIATLSGKKRAYTDKVKFKKNYVYAVVAYQKKGGKYEEIGSDICFAYSGVAKTEWDEYSFCDAMTTPNMIPIKASVLNMGFRPDGFQIYRSSNGKDFKKIKTIQKKSYTLYYEDQSVQSHNTYYYKIRAFRRIGEKKYYGAFSSVERHSAVNNEGKYSVKVLSEEGNAIPSLTICLTSDMGNGDLLFGAKHNDCWGYLNIDYSNILELDLWQYSYDNKIWYSLKDKSAVLKPGQSIYLKFVETENGKPKPFAFHIGDRVTEITDCMVNYDYNGLSYLLSIDLKKMNASVCVDGEKYH